MNKQLERLKNNALYIALAALVIGVYLLGHNTVPPQVSSPASGEISAEAMAPIRFTNSGQKMTFMTGSTLQVDSGTTETHGNAPTFSGGATFSTVAPTFNVNPIAASESITPTDNGVLTPTKQFVTLTPAGAVAVTLGACTTSTSAVLYNSVNANVVITDTGNFIGAGNQTLGQYDAMPMACFGTKWVQTGPVSAN